MIRIGSLFTGTGALDMAARAIFGGRTVWHSDIKPAAVALLAHRFPGTPNLGDFARLFPAVGPLLLEALDLEPIDVLTAGWPCQPYSSAGKRLGEADPRALWPNVARAVGELRPAVFLGENVARVATNGELRRVVRSLAALGYVGTWRCVTAASVGAPHKRDRCFVVAVRADVAADPGRGPAALADALTGGGAGALGVGATQSGGRSIGTPDLTLLPTPCSRDGKGPGLRTGERPDGYARTAAQLDLPGAVQLLPTPTQSMTTGAGTSGRDGGLNLQTAITLLPTPSASSYGTNQGGAAGRVGPVRESLDTMARHDRLRDWGRYAAAVERWEHVLGRPAPAPTQIGVRGGVQLAPAFVEWMMGLPAGWVSQVEDLAPRPTGLRNARLSLLGDGVVPQQAEAAYRACLAELLETYASAA